MTNINKLIELFGNYNKYLEILIETDQHELLNHEKLNEKNVYDIISQIKEFEMIYPDGLGKYLERAKILLYESKNKINKYAKYIITRPDNVIRIKFNWKYNIYANSENEKMIELYPSDNIVEKEFCTYDISTTFFNNDNATNYDVNDTYDVNNDNYDVASNYYVNTTTTTTNNNNNNGSTYDSTDGNTNENEELENINKVDINRVDKISRMDIYTHFYSTKEETELIGANNKNCSTVDSESMTVQTNSPVADVNENNLMKMESICKSRISSSDQNCDNFMPFVTNNEYPENKKIKIFETNSPEKNDTNRKPISFIETNEVVNNEMNFLSNSCSIDTFLHYEKMGLQEIDTIAFVLLAGGLGERLNYNDIKLKLKIDTVSEQSYIAYYCKHIKAFQEYIKKHKGKEVDIPFILMVSEDTEEKTKQYFEENKYFNLKKKQIHFLQQQKVFCLKDNEAHLYFAYENNKFKIFKKPHGHGDVHTLMKQSNIIEGLIKRGYKYLYFFQDTNALALRILFVCLGVSIEKQLHMNFMGISRKPREEIGVLCKLINEENASLTVNLEYNVFESILNYNGEKESVDRNGYSLYPGNSGAILFEINRYNEILNETNGLVPEFVNPKYTDNTRTHFKSPTRVECMMQDFALYFNKESDRVGVTELNRFLCFSAVKNDIVNAQKKMYNHMHPECMLTGEADLYYCNCAFIQLACLYHRKKAVIDRMPIQIYNGIEYFFPPKVLLEPQFAFTLNEIINKITGNVTLRRDSTLWIKSDTVIKDLYVDGTLIIENSKIDQTSKPIILKDNCYIKNKGYHIVHIQNTKEMTLPDYITMRGYCILKQEEEIISQ